MADELVLEQLRAIRRDISGLATNVSGLTTKEDLSAAVAPLATVAELQGLRTELLRHFVEVETRLTTEVHELIALLRELVASRDRLATRMSQLEQDVQDLKSRTG